HGHVQRRWDEHGQLRGGLGGEVGFGGGTHTITLGAANSFSGLGTMSFSGGTVTIGGTGTYNVTGTSSVSGATLNLNLASGAGNWAESSGSLQGSGTITVVS